MELPEALQKYATMRAWVCYPLIWDAKKHHGFGGYAKPPLNPHCLNYARTDDAATCGTFEEATARIGDYATIDGSRHKIEGVGLCLKPAGLVAVDLDSVAKVEPERRATYEALSILELLDSYTELSPSQSGFHVLISADGAPEDVPTTCNGRRDINKGNAAEYEYKNSGYVTITGDIVGGRSTIYARGNKLAEFFQKYMTRPGKTDPAQGAADRKQPQTPVEPPKGRGLYTWERWQEEAAKSSDEELLQKIYSTPKTGETVRDLYQYGNISKFSNDHSYADRVLIEFLYGFTHDAGRVEALFKNSALYRAKGKSRGYLAHLIEGAARRNVYYIGHITPTLEERRAYAEARETEERERIRQRMAARENPFRCADGTQAKTPED